VMPLGRRSGPSSARMVGGDDRAVSAGGRVCRAARESASFESVFHVDEKGSSFGGSEDHVSLLTAALDAVGVRSSLVCGPVTGAPPVRMDGVRIVAGLAERRPPRRDRRCGGRDGGRGATRVTALAPLGYYIRTTSEGGACTSLRPSPTRGFGSRRSTARRSGPTSTRRYTRSARTRTSHRSQPERATPGERGRHGPSLANVPDGAPSAPTDQR